MIKIKQYSFIAKSKATSESFIITPNESGYSACGYSIITNYSLLVNIGVESFNSSKIAGFYTNQNSQDTTVTFYIIFIKS